MEFATEAYNYNTFSDSDPRNLVLLCTSQGVAVQQDGQGAKRLLHHTVDEDSCIHRYWLEAERSNHKVGGPQCESEQERKDALARGKATASVIGTRAMGTRFNVLMTIQVPLQQKKPKLKRPKGGLMSGDSKVCLEMLEVESLEKQLKNMLRLPFPSAAPRAMQKGTANAARVSRGSEYDTWSGLSISHPQRNHAEHVTVTVVIYNTVADGVPTEEDVVAAIDDLEDLYAKCGANGRLSASTFDFMKKKLTINNVMDIFTKTQNQPFPAAPAKNRCLPCLNF